MIWTLTEEDLLSFISYLNSRHLTIKFTSSHSSSCIPFLYVIVSLNDGNIEKISILNQRTNVSTSYTLHATRYTPNDRAIPFSLALRLRRICSSDETLTLHSNELIQYLNNRGCNLSLLKHEGQRVHAITRTDALKPSISTSNLPSRVLFVITYNPALRSISSIIHLLR